MHPLKTVISVGVAALLLPATASAAGNRTATAPSVGPAVVVDTRGHDFNNDLRDDLAIGIPGAVVNGHASAGAVQILYGSADGLRSAGSQLWTLQSSGIPGNAATRDKLGWALASADFDADGYDDLAIGAPGRLSTYNDVQYPDSGVVYVLFGGAHGLHARATHVLVSNPQCPSCEFGYALGIADTMSDSGHGAGDGYPDLIVGAPGMNWFFQVSGRGISGAAPPGRYGHNPGGLNNGARFGASIAGGDFLGTGDSIAVGSPGENAQVGKTTVLAAGKVRVFNHGSTTSPIVLQQDSFGGNPAETNDRFGAALEGADVDGNGWDDLLVGVPGEDLGSSTIDSGAVQVHRVNDGGGFGADPAPLTLTEDTPHVPGTAASGDAFGTSVVAGDPTGDSALDIIVGIPGKRVGGEPGAGAVVVIVNSGDGTPSTAGSQLWTQDRTGIADSAETGDHLGRSLSVGQFGNGFGIDLAIGIPDENVSGHGKAGAVAVLYSDGMAIHAPHDQLWTRDSGGIPGSPHARDRFGWGLP